MKTARRNYETDDSGVGSSLGCLGMCTVCDGGDARCHGQEYNAVTEDDVKANKDGKWNGMFDIHIAIPKNDGAVLESVKAELRDFIPKFKYFIHVKNFERTPSASWTRDTTAAAHDLEEPGAMATVKVGNDKVALGYEQAREHVRKAMAVLESHGIYDGNFEVEHFLSESLQDFTDFTMERDFPGYAQIMPPESPSHENHIIYRGKLADLPTMEQILQRYNAQMHVTPHQAVLFARSPTPKPDDLASLALTFYQDNRDAVLSFGRKLEENADKLRCSDIITEQVVIVGEKQ